MSMTASGSKEPRAEINVTPLIDVLLVLLIIFMVIEPTAVRGLDARIPQPPKSLVQAEPDPIVVQVLRDEQRGVTYSINQTSVSRAELEPKLAVIFATRTDKVMFIQGDAGLEFSSIADIIDSGHQAGVDTIGIVTPQARRGKTE